MEERKRSRPHPARIARQADGADGAVDWPRRVRLTADWGSAGNDSVVLATAAVGPDGDLDFTEAMVISLHGALPNSLCSEGKFQSLEDPAEPTDQCPAGESWTERIYLGGSALGSNRYVGETFKVRAGRPAATYRMRVIADHTGDDTWIELEYRPLP